MIIFFGFSSLSDPYVFQEKQVDWKDEYIQSLNSNYAIIIQKRDADKIDWGQLMHKGYKLILLTYTNSLQDLQKCYDTKLFQECIAVENFSYESLYAIVSDLLEKYKSSDNQVKILTTSEDTLISNITLSTQFKLGGANVSDIRSFLNKIASKELIAKHFPQFIHKFKKFLPEHFKVNEDTYIQESIKELGEIIVAKPTAGMGNRNISILNNAVQLRSWCIQHKNDSEQYELDEYIAGDFLQVDLMVKNKIVLHSNVERYLVSTHLFMSGQIHGAIVLQKNDPDFSNIISFAKNILDQFPYLPDGCICIQFFKRKSDNQLIFLEIEARPPGTGISQALCFSTGLDWRASHYAIQMDMDISTINNNLYTAWAMFPTKEGQLSIFNDLPEFKSTIKTLKWKYNVGDKMPKPASLVDYAGILILTNDNYSDLLADFNKLHSCIPFGVKPITGLAPRSAIVDSDFKSSVQLITELNPKVVQSTSALITCNSAIIHSPRSIARSSAQSLVTKAIKRPNLGSNSVNIHFPNQDLAQQFCDQIRLLDRTGLTTNQLKHFEIIGEQYVMTLKSNEYNNIMADSNAYAALLPSDAQRSKQSIQLT